MNNFGFNIEDDLFAEDLTFTNNPKIHIRLQKRNGKKSISIVSGLPTTLDFKSTLKVLKKSLNCNGCITTDEESGQILQVQGDHRLKLKEYILDKNLSLKEDIVMH
jgi:translation initiation factor 1